MNKEEQIKLINNIQNNYVEQLEKIIKRKVETKDELYEINFGSKTGTGKSIMIAKLLNNCSDLFFMITTLSRGGLNQQLKRTLDEKTIHNNFVCYGSCDLTANTKKDAEDIWNEILEKNVNNKPIIWLRDEGHIKTNIFSAAFKKKVNVIVNISATNLNQNDIDCNFTDTIMLRHPKLYTMAHFDEAINKLLEVKEQHKKVKNYNPCMVVRCLDEAISKDLRKSAEAKGLKCVDLNDDNVKTLDICDDDSKFDVIINKMKIIEGVDIRRCHVIYIQNNIGKDTTNIQLVGRSRRNALLWRDDIDIFSKENEELLKQTLVSYIYYNNEKGLSQDSNGEFLSVCCNIISVESLRPNSVISVQNGYLTNGYQVYELVGQTGDFEIAVDEETGFNYIKNLSEIYEEIFDEYNFRPAMCLSNNQAYVEGTNLILNKEEFIIKKYDNDAKEWVHTFDGTQYNGPIHPNLLKKILPISEEEFDSRVIKNRFNLCNNFKFVKSNKLFKEPSGDTFNYSAKSSSYYYSPSITYKLGQDSKLRRYIQNKYKAVLDNFETIGGKNNFNFDKKLNSCLGYVVEYYTKYKLLGDEFLLGYLEQAINEFKENDSTFNFEVAVEIEKVKVAIRACYLKYAAMMAEHYGSNVAYLIPSVKTSDVIKENNKEWINTVIKLSENAVKFVSSTMNYDGKTFSLLECAGVKGVADFISEDTIIDLKTTSNISKQHIMQVLSYYELSKLRSDLHINKIFVYDCVTNRCVKIDNLDSNNYFDLNEACDD